MPNGGDLLVAVILLGVGLLIGHCAPSLPQLAPVLPQFAFAPEGLSFGALGLTFAHPCAQFSHFGGLLASFFIFVVSNHGSYPLKWTIFWKLSFEQMKSVRKHNVFD